MDKGSIRAFEEMNGSPPEALVNLGILYDQQGQAEKAYDTWVKARAKGATAPNLTKWIDAKKRIFGF
jgi:hypothetical protein